MDAKSIYRSANGDDWLVSENAADGSYTVTHRPNASSGGAESTMPADEFMQRSAGSPEVRAVRDYIDRIRH